MSRITANQEELLAASRSRNRQNKQTPFLVRDDGVLFPNTPLNLRNPRFRPYTGDMRATLEERMAYVRGELKKRKVVYNPADDAPFDLGKADRDSLLTFMMDEYGVALDPTKPMGDLRREAASIANAEAEGGMGQGIGVQRSGADATGTIRNVTAGTGTVNAGHIPTSSRGRNQPPQLTVHADSDEDREQHVDTREGYVTETRQVPREHEGVLRGQLQAEESVEATKADNADAPKAAKQGGETSTTTPPARQRNTPK